MTISQINVDRLLACHSYGSHETPYPYLTHETPYPYPTPETLYSHPTPKTPYSNPTLKNEISYGLPVHEIAYLKKRKYILLIFIDLHNSIKINLLHTKYC